MEGTLGIFFSCPATSRGSGCSPCLMPGKCHGCYREMQLDIKLLKDVGSQNGAKKGETTFFWSYFFPWTSSQWSIVEPCRVICLLLARQCCWSLSPWETAASARGWWVQGGCTPNCWTSCQGHLYQHRSSALALPRCLNTWSFRSWNARWVWLGESHVMN